MWLQSRITETWLQKRWSHQPSQSSSLSDTAGAFVPFCFRNEPHHVTPISLRGKNLLVISQALQASFAMSSHFETDKALS